MPADYFDKYTFLCEMYDKDADEIKELTLNFFPFDNSVQVIESKKGKNLLRRVHLPPLKLEMLQIGNIINIFSKLLHIIDCAPATRRILFDNVQSTFAIIKPVPPSEHGKIITFIMKKGFRIVRMRNGKVTKEFALELYSHLSGSHMMPIIIDYVTGGEIIGLELVAPNAVEKWRKCLGNTDPAIAAPGTLRRLYGENKLKNVAHGCQTQEDANRVWALLLTSLNQHFYHRRSGKTSSDVANRIMLLHPTPNDDNLKVRVSNVETYMLDLYFGYEHGVPRVPYRATMTECTCCIIKPHAIIDGNVGSILEQISTSEGFYISAIAMFSVSLLNAKEFYEIYRGVLPEYETMCIQLAEGSCIALEVKSKDPKCCVVTEFRKLCGPRDPELCRQLYPNSIRAHYGKSILHNAVHCTDLPEEGEVEVEYFFKLLAFN